MNTERNDIDMDRIRMNIVGETKRIILDEEYEENSDPDYISEDEVRRAVERLNPDPHSLKSRG